MEGIGLWLSESGWGKELTAKGHQGTWGIDRDGLCLDCGGGYTTEYHYLKLIELDNKKDKCFCI